MTNPPPTGRGPQYAYRAARDDVSARQVEALRYASHGLGGPHIARAMEISAATVKDHLTMCRLVLGAKNTTHAVAIAIRSGLIE